MNEKIISLNQKDDTIFMKLTNGDNKVVYMNYAFSKDTNYQLIFIEADTFRKYLGRNIYDDFSEYATDTEDELRQDYKFEKAEKRFLDGKDNPVDVAKVSLLHHTVLPSIGVTDGITRTIWIMANCYKIIPVEFGYATSDFLNEKGVYTLNNIRE